MFFGGLKYIEQNYPKWQYSPVQFVMSKAGTGKAIFQAANQNAKGILIKGIQWELTGSDPGVPILFTDNLGNTLIYQAAKGAYNAKTFFDYFIPYKTIAFIQASSTAVDFIVDFQFLSLPEIGDQE